MQQYHDLMRYVLEHGNDRPDRTGTGTRSIFGYQCRYDLSKGFPLLTTKKLNIRAIVYELLWFISGSTDVRDLRANQVHIWDPWADEQGDLGPVYGEQWRKCRMSPHDDSVDQLGDVIAQLRKDPHSRRMVVSSWNPVMISQMKLPPCHCLFQFYVANGKLSCQLYQRSADIFIGVPFNIASYALLTHMVAQVVGLDAGDFIHTFGDAHLYLNHIDQAREQLTRQPRPLPKLKLDSAVLKIDDFTFNSIEILNYDPHPHIKAPVAV